MKEAINRLQRPHMSVKLLIEGKYNLSYYTVIVNRRIFIEWYYDGLYKIEYMNKDNEIGKLFGHPKFARITAKKHEVNKIIYGKKEAEKLRKFYDETPIMYSPHWSSPRALITHLNRNFKTIEVLSTSFEPYPGINVF